MLDLNIRALDPEKSAAGVWIDYDDGISFLIARSNTPGYRKAVRQIAKRHKQQIENQTMSDRKSDEITAGLLQEYILLDWRGIMQGDGSEFPYTRENCVALLSSEDHVELRLWIMAQSENMENFRAEEVKKPAATL